MAATSVREALRAARLPAVRGYAKSAPPLAGTAVPGPGRRVEPSVSGLEGMIVLGGDSEALSDRFAEGLRGASRSSHFGSGTTSLLLLLATSPGAAACSSM
jgi:hypothetical protein